MPEWLKNVFAQFPGVVAQISRASALTPLLLALALATALAGVVSGTVGASFALTLILSIFGVLILAIIVAFFVILKNYPYMLRSERHVIQQRVLSLLGDQAHGFGTSSRDLIAVLNPENPIKNDDQVSPPKVLQGPQRPVTEA